MNEEEISIRKRIYKLAWILRKNGLTCELIEKTKELLAFIKQATEEKE